MGRRRLGVQGEEAATRYLEEAGCQVLCRNFRTPRGEIDLVARDGECLVFVEVRTWQTEAFGSPLEFIGRKKQMRMRGAAEEFLARGCEAGDVRFDVIVVVAGPGGRLEIKEHLRDAF